MENRVPKICIVGCGFGGICAATRLCREMSNKNFVIFDMNPEIGGTWYSNSYLGSGSDAPTHLYALSSEPKFDWSHTYATQPEIQSYLKGICLKYDLYDKIRLNHQVLKIRFDKKKLWNVTYKSLETDVETQEEFNVVILATGILRNPKIPKEFNTFKGGKIFHTAKWDHNCVIKDKVVAVVGVGSSGIQVIPELAKTVKKLIIYQRRASYILPKKNKPYSILVKLLFKYFPTIQCLYRIFWFNYFEKFWHALRPGTEISEQVTQIANNFRERELQDFPELLNQQKPKDPYGCQRVLFSANYFATLKQPHVKLVSFQKSLQVKENSIIADDKDEEQVEIVILATGFQTEEYFSPIEIWDENDDNLLDKWNNEGPSLLYGITAHTLPNLFFLWGPNTV